MTAICRASCCTTPRLTVSDLFESGYRRSRLPSLSTQGPACADVEANSASFSLERDNGRIADVRFRASSCTTLIAYCEFIAQTVPGSDAEIAAALTPQQLADAVPGVPPLKRARALLAIAAFRAALDCVSASSQHAYERRALP